MAKEQPEQADIEIGARLRAARQSRGMSLEKLGEKVGVTYQQIQKYETGANRVSISTGLRLCEALGITMAQLAGQDGMVPVGVEDVARRIETMLNDAAISIPRMLRNGGAA